MQVQASLRRLIALQLLLALPAVAGLRLGLDVRAASAAIDGVEAQHSVGCGVTHDHRLCALLLRSPWSPAPATPLFAASHPPATSAFASTIILTRDDQLRLSDARAPPLTTRS